MMRIQAMFASIHSKRQPGNSHELRTLGQGERPAKKTFRFHAAICDAAGAAILRRNSAKPRQGQCLDSNSHYRRPQTKGARGGLMESVATERSWRLFDESGVRATLRNHGAQQLGARGIQLFRARYREHGSSAALRDTGATETVADSASEWRDTFCIPDARTRGGLLGCNQHPMPHREARRCIRHQWTKMVVFRRR